MIKKTRNLTGIDAENDLRYGFDFLIRQTESDIIKFDITNTNAKNIEDLNFKLTNKVFNSLRKQFYCEKINYLFVIEYPEIISKGNYMIDHLEKIEFHAHIIIDTSIPIYAVKNKLVDILGEKCDIYIENISPRDDKEKYIKYLVKQNKYFNYKSYNFKMNYTK
jgi:hypothetical protein